MEKNNEMKALFLDGIWKNYQTLARMTKKKKTLITDIRNERKDYHYRPCRD